LTSCDKIDSIQKNIEAAEKSERNYIFEKSGGNLFSNLVYYTNQSDTFERIPYFYYY